MSIPKVRFSLRTFLVTVTIFAVATAFITHYYETVIAITFVIFWVGDLLVHSGFFKAWPELQGPHIRKPMQPANDTQLDTKPDN
jgi:hypothetical protein